MDFAAARQIVYDFAMFLDVVQFDGRPEGARGPGGGTGCSERLLGGLSAEALDAKHPLCSRACGVLITRRLGDSAVSSSRGKHLPRECGAQAGGYRRLGSAPVRNASPGILRVGRARSSPSAFRRRSALAGVWQPAGRLRRLRKPYGGRLVVASTTRRGVATEERVADETSHTNGLGQAPRSQCLQQRTGEKGRRTPSCEMFRSRLRHFLQKDRTTQKHGSREKRAVH